MDGVDWLVWAVVVFALLVFMAAIILRLRTKLAPIASTDRVFAPAMTTISADSGFTMVAPSEASNEQFGPTGPTGLAGYPNTVLTNGPTGATGLSGTLATVPTQVGVLNTGTIALIQSSQQPSMGPFVLAVTQDQRPVANQQVPAGLNGDVSTHVVQYDPVTQTWRDFGPWLGATGSAGPAGPAGAAPPGGSTGPTGAPGYGPTGPTGSTGLAGFAGPSIFNPGLRYGPATDGDMTVAGNVQLSRDMFYGTLNVPLGSAVYTNGYRIFCATNFHLDGLISNAGHNGSDATQIPTGFTGIASPNAGGAGGPAGSVGGGGQGGFGLPTGLTGWVVTTGDTGAIDLTSLFSSNGQPCPYAFFTAEQIAAGQTGLYKGGSVTGGAHGGQVTALDRFGSLAALNAVLWPIAWPTGIAAPLTISGGSGGGAGYTTEPSVVAAGGGGGGGVVVVSAATMSTSNNPSTGQIDVRGGNAGLSLSSVVTGATGDAPAAAGAGGLVILSCGVPETIPPWSILVNAGTGAGPAQPGQVIVV